MKRLEGKIALITGTGGGQGRAAALRFAREGATVIGCDLDAQSHKGTCAILASEGLQLQGSAPVDLGDVEQAKAWVEDAAEQFGRIDILYNNASATRFAPIGEFSIDDWHFVIRNELDLVFYTTRYAWQYLARQGGTIINVASTAAWCGSKLTGKTAHSAAKGAVVSFTRQLAVEGAPVGIRAISISPGFIKTPGTAPFIENPEMRGKLLDGVLLDRPGESEEVAALAAFIASGEATYMTGSDVVIDGGLLAT
jgi:NAD(P)-dependent dehydrogenase (short-subunit alcohol dehydrogenase family)|tara:strand:- start:38549 stop:39307 length:759 start_codon:yes stop_codon:yes gene_type:complete